MVIVTGAARSFIGHTRGAAALPRPVAPTPSHLDHRHPSR